MNSRDSYADFGPTLACEKLHERHGTELSKACVRRMQYDKVMYLLEDLPAHRQLIHRYMEVAEYPDGRVVLWADGASLPYTTYHRLSQIDQGAIVENKRLGHVLEIVAQVQALRDVRHQAGPSRTLLGELPRPPHPPSNVKRQRRINRLDLDRAIKGTPIPQSGRLPLDCGRWVEPCPRAAVDPEPPFGL